MLELIITHPLNLERVYGKSGSGHIFRAIENLCETMGVDGIDAKVVHLDEPTPVDWRLSSERFLDLIDEYAPEQILIVGGDDIVPFCRIPDPVPHPDDDEWIYSDSPDTWWTRQNAPGPGVGRMPGDGTSDAHFIIEQLQRAAAAHRQHSIVLTIPTYAFSAELWAESARQVLDDAGIPQPWTLYQCPPMVWSPATRSPSRYRRRSFPGSHYCTSRCSDCIVGHRGGGIQKMSRRGKRAKCREKPP